jgi:translocation and assembly module TamB
MSESGAKPRRKFWKYLLSVLLGGLMLLGVAAWYMTTDSFQAWVRQRLVTELERITGGRVHLGSFHTVPFRLQVEVRNLTIHGLERPVEVPYAHVDRVVAEIKIISILGREFGFHTVLLEHPVVHIILYPDGTTNQPQPMLGQNSANGAVELLFSLSINRLDVRRGEVLWDNQRIPLDFVANDLSADMTYSLLHRGYEGNLRLGKVDTHFKDYRPIAWMAEAQFSLGQNNIEVSSLKATSGRSSVTGSARVKNFREFKIEAAYDAAIDLAETAAIMRRPEARRGIVHTAGQGYWSNTDFSSTGKLSLKNFDWRDQAVKLQDVSLNAQFSVNPEHLTISQIQAQLLGGSVSGDAEIANWLALTTTKLAKGKRLQNQTGVVRLHMKELSTSEIATALATSARPFNRINFAGAANASVEAGWTGSPQNTQANIVLDVVPPSRAAAGQLPLKVRARAIYHSRSGELDLAEFSGATPASKVVASGTMSSTASLNVSISTTEIGEWQPILYAAGYQERIPVKLHGHATFSGTASGKLSAISFVGDLQSQDFDWLILATSRTPERQVHWDSLAANIQLSPNAFVARRGTLRHGATNINFDVTAGLQQRQLVDNSAFTARLNMQNADISDILALAKFEYPAQGTMNVFLQASGTKAQPRGDGHIQLTNGSIYGEPVERLNSELHFDRGQAELRNIQLTHYDSHVTGDANYNLSTRAFHFNLAGTNFDLTRIPQIQNRGMSVEGRMDFTAVGSGTPDAPAMNAIIRLRDLAFDHERAGDFTVNAVTQGADLHLTGQSQFEHAELSIDGNIHLRGDWPSTVNLHFNQLDIDALLRTYLKGRVTGHSSIAGDLRLQGPLRRPRELNVVGNLSQFYADVENIKIHNDGPVRFDLSSQLLRIEEFRFTGEGTDLLASGTVQLNGEHRLDFRAQGRVNLKLIESFNPDFTSSGDVTVDVTVSGTVENPVTQGRLQVANGSVAYADLPSALNEINGSLVFNQDRLQIETLTARTGGGLLTFGGYASSYNRQIEFNLTVQGQDVRLRYPPGVSSTANADLHFVGTPGASTLSGDITVTKLAMTPGFDFAAYLQRSAQTSTLPQTNPLLNRIRLDVHITTTPELQMQTAVVRLSGDADMHMRGSAAKPVLLGRADVIEGDVYFNGTKYRLERGDVTFVNPVTSTPVLDLQMSTRVRDYDVTVNLNGELSKLNMKYRSEPPLPEADVVALLALGRTREESAQMQQSGQSALSQEASNAILTEALNATVANRVQRLFGVSRIKIDPQGLSTETNPARGPQVTIEQQVAGDLTLTYSTNVSQASQQIIQVEYNVTRNVSIVGIRDQNGVVSIDVRIRQRKK